MTVQSSKSALIPVPSRLATSTATASLIYLLWEKRPGGIANSMALFGRRHLGLFTLVSMNFDPMISNL